jgi:hypothetical protein
VPIGVGVAVGTSILIAGSVLVFFYQRKRRRQAPVRAETPPPFEFSFINNQAPGWLGPSYGDAKLQGQQSQRGRGDGVHGGSYNGNNNRNKDNTPEIGGAAGYELP